MGAPNAVDLVRLTGRQLLAWVEAPDAAQQSLTAKYLVDSGDAAAEGVRHVKDGAVRIGERRRLAQPPGADGIFLPGRLRTIEQLNGAARPHRELAQQAAIDPAHGSLTPTDDRKGCQEVHHDAVVVPGVEGDVVAASLRDRAHDVERLIPTERSDLDRPDVGNLRELAPEGKAQNSSADRRLQVKAEERDHLGHLAAVQ